MSACTDGTVLIGGKCVDPAHGLTVDVEEGQEPNGLGLVLGVENSDDAAGMITLKAEGDTTVVHGHITPFQDADADGQSDPDFDTYLLQVSKPTLIDISVDGVGGIDGAFYTIGGADGLAAWERYGVATVGDTAHRQLFLPAAGIYGIIVADTRSMFIGNFPPNAAGLGGAPGGPDAEYYMSLTVLAEPSATPITVGADGKASVIGTIGNEVKFFSAPMGLGFNDAGVVFGQVQANPAIVLYQNDNFRREATNLPGGFFGGGTPADLFFAGYKTGDSSLVVVDYSFNTGIEPIDFDLEVVTTGSAALATDGTDVTETEISNAPAAGTDFNSFFMDVGATDDIVGLKLHWNHPVDGLIADSDGFILAFFTFDPFDGFVGNTFTDYAGAVRFPAAGRYYFIGYDPAGVGGTDTLTATSTIAKIDTTAVVESTPLTNQTVNAFNLNPFTYAAGTTDPWQGFNVIGALTGNREVNFIDPVGAYGSLSSFDATDSFGDPLPVGADIAPVFSNVFTGTPSVPIGHIVGLEGINNYLVTVQTVNAAGTLTLDFAPRVVDHDFGTVASGDTVNNTTNLTTAITKRLFFIKTTPGNLITITLPSPAPANLRINFLGADESNSRTINAGGVGATETVQFAQNASGFTALSVDSAIAITATLGFTITLKVDPPFYTAHDSATAFDDACVGGTTQVLTATGSFPANDDGITAVIDAPTGFTFYGVAAPQFIASSNGFISFDTGLTSALASSHAMPDAVGEANVAAFWDDLVNAVVCTKTAGTKLIIQWTGNEFNATTTVAAQAILDGADGSIEFVYGTRTANGSRAVAGVQDVTGVQATETSEFGTITPNTSKKLTHP